MKPTLLIILIALLPMAVLAQQDPAFSFVNEYNSFVNPSFVVNDYKLNADVRHRQQWVGFDGAPVVTLANASFFVDKAKSGFGVTVLNDQLGAQNNWTALLNYAFDIRVGDHHIVPGIQLGAVVHRLDGSQLNPIQANDPNIIQSTEGGQAFDLGLSLAYRWKGLILGFSAKHLTAPTIVFGEGFFQSEYSVVRHYYGYASYEALLGQHFRLKPIFGVQTDAASTSFNGQLWFGGRALTKSFDGPSIGVGYRHQDAILVAAEFRFKWFTIGYAYDYTFSGLRDFSNGSHEGFLRVHLFQIAQAIEE